MYICVCMYGARYPRYSLRGASGAHCWRTACHLFRSLAALECLSPECLSPGALVGQRPAATASDPAAPSVGLYAPRAGPG